MKLFSTLFALFICFVSVSQQTETVDFLKLDAAVTPMAAEEMVTGNLQFAFKILDDTPQVYVDAVNMKVLDYSSEANIQVVAEDKKIVFKHPFKKGTTYQVSFTYQATPAQTLYFTGDQLWTQGQGKYTSHWLPSIDDMNDKIEFDLTVVAPADKTVIANGKLIKTLPAGERTAWHFDMQHPMSSYLVAMVVGDFTKNEITTSSGVPVSLYYQLKEAEKAEPTYRYTQQIFDFLEAEIGVPYPWQNYKQVPVRDFLYAGMENTTATIFSEAFVVDSIGFNDRNYVNVNAHELAHQWFGNLVTETSGKHHWLQEGFATYYAMLAERSIFGEEYYYWKLFQSAEQLKALSDEGKGEALLNDKASSLTFYEKGAWALHILKELIGEEAFKSAVKNYLNKYQFKNVTTENFMVEVKAVSTVDLTKFEADWLEQSAFKAEEAYQSLIKSPFINRLLEVTALRAVPIEDKKRQLKTILTFPDDFTGQEAIYQLQGEPLQHTLSLYQQGFDSNNLFVRQAIALTLEEIPLPLQTAYEGLLKDPSYVTIEAALYRLWAQFPNKRSKYLNSTKDIVGFQNRNVRQLWLALAIADSAYEPQQTEAFGAELKSYASPSYSFEVRETAFNYLNELQLWDSQTLHHLVNASVHHNWRFRNFARGLLDTLLKDDDLRNLLKASVKTLSEKEKGYLERINF